MPLLALALAGATVVADSPQDAFVKAWKGRMVVVTARLYSLLYNERGRLGTSRSGFAPGAGYRHPNAGRLLQFDGRQGRGAVVQHTMDHSLPP